MKYLVNITITMLLFGFGVNTNAQPPKPVSNPSYQPPYPPTYMQYRNYGRIWVEKDMNQDGYQLRIYTSDAIDPESIQVSIVGRMIIIENKQTYQHQKRNDRGYYSYSRSSQNFRRRFSIPRNADMDNMKRSEENGVIIVTFPFLYPPHENP